MAKSMITFQSSYEASLRNITRELANVDRHAGLVDAERKSTQSRSEYYRQVEYR